MHASSVCTLTVHVALLVGLFVTCNCIHVYTCTSWGNTLYIIIIYTLRSGFFLMCRDMYRDIVVQKKMNLTDREFDVSLAENWG